MSKSFNSSTGSSSAAAAGAANNTRPRRFPDGLERPANTPFCKVCYDAGHPVSEYTDHFVKNTPGPDGKVICPTLLNQNCRICKKPGHTSTYCAEYRPHRDEREREPRYIEREEREPRYIEREEREREPRYIERERESRRDDRRRDEPCRDISFNRLREDTDRHEREIRNRDDAYDREQDRRSKPWLQAALVRPSSSTQQPRDRSGPYAHPHGPRVRLELESRALSSATATVAATPALPAIDFRKVDLHHAAAWGDEEPGEMAGHFFEKLAKESMTNSLQ